ncbi:aldo/keto reductase [Streptomyces sp. NPDC059917]|uniref:aldo/keto reductase n=1 Tax=Streptomyces sp. NPDC059917 TaxID=3347002 RepID=UPI003664B8D7
MATLGGRMIYRRVGNSELVLPAVSCGLWQGFGSDGDYSDRRRVILSALDIGVTHFDLANNYGPPNGQAEMFFGRVLGSDLARRRDEIVISTKAGYPMWPGPYGEGGSRKHIVAALDQSLARMGLDHVDIFYSHRYCADTPLEETMDALAFAVKSGKARYVGISSYSRNDSYRSLEILRSLGVNVLLHQPSYSMMNRWIEEDGLLDLVGEERMGCVVFGTMAQGLLSNRYLSGMPADSRAAQGKHPKRRLITPELLSRVRRLSGLASRRGQTLAQLAISWALRDSRVTSAVVGVSSVDQLRENVKACRNLCFSPSESAEVDAIFREAQIYSWRP